MATKSGKFAPRENATMTVEQAAKILGMGRNQGYLAAARGDIPCVRIGKRFFVLTEPFNRMLAGGGSPREVKET